MKFIVILFFSIGSLYAYEKGYIDTHGGKTDTLGTSSSSFSQQGGLGSSLLKNKKEKKKTVKKETTVETVQPTKK